MELILYRHYLLFLAKLKNVQLPKSPSLPIQSCLTPKKGATQFLFSGSTSTSKQTDKPPLPTLPTFQDRVHLPSVQRRPHPDEEQLLRSLGQVVHQQLGVGRYGLDGLVHRFPPDLGRHQVDGGAEDVRDPQETHPVAVAHPPAPAAGDFVVAAEAVADLEGAVLSSLIRVLWCRRKLFS